MHLQYVLKLCLLISMSVFSIFTLSAQNKTEGSILYNLVIDAPPIFSQLSPSARGNLPLAINHSARVYFKGPWVRYEDTTLVAMQKKKTEIAYKNSEAGWLLDQKDNIWYLLHQLDGKIYYAEEAASSLRWRFTVSLYDVEPGTTLKFQRQVIKMNDPKALKLTEETKVILGYTCKKGYYNTGIETLDGQENNDAVTFWYTTDLPANVSPVMTTIVPGAILELDAHRMHYKASSVSFNAVDETNVALPQHGIKMTIFTEENMIDRYMIMRD